MKKVQWTFDSEAENQSKLPHEKATGSFFPHHSLFLYSSFLTYINSHNARGRKIL